MMTPYRIQRANINNPLADAGVRLSEAVRFHYMGSTEFEFGALPESFRELGRNQANWSIRRVPDIVEGEHALRVFSALSDEQFVEYAQFLLTLRTSPAYTVRLRERSEFGLAERKPLAPTSAARKRPRTKAIAYAPTYADFWWDIDNHVMFSFHKIFMNRLAGHVAQSLIHMAAQAKTTA